jgi:hypothetical protein
MGAYWDIVIYYPLILVVSEFLVLKFHRNSNQLSVTHPALGDDLLAKWRRSRIAPFSTATSMQLS